MADEHLPVATGLCNTCRFWFNGMSDFEDIAECRRFPPSLPTDRPLKGRYPGEPFATTYWVGRTETLWPLTQDYGSCGEYSARKDGTAFVWDMGE